MLTIAPHLESVNINIHRKFQIIFYGNFLIKLKQNHKNRNHFSSFFWLLGKLQ